MSFTQIEQMFQRTIFDNVLPKSTSPMLIKSTSSVCEHNTEVERQQGSPWSTIQLKPWRSLSQDTDWWGLDTPQRSRRLQDNNESRERTDPRNSEVPRRPRVVLRRIRNRGCDSCRNECATDVILVEINHGFVHDSTTISARKWWTRSSINEVCVYRRQTQERFHTTPHCVSKVWYDESICAWCGVSKSNFNFSKMTQIWGKQRLQVFCCTTFWFYMSIVLCSTLSSLWLCYHWYDRIVSSILRISTKEAALLLTEWGIKQPWLPSTVTSHWSAGCEL